MRPALECLVIVVQLAHMRQAAENATIALMIIRHCLREKDYFLLKGGPWH